MGHPVPESRHGNIAQEKMQAIVQSGQVGVMQQRVAGVRVRACAYQVGPAQRPALAQCWPGPGPAPPQGCRATAMGAIRAPTRAPSANNIPAHTGPPRGGEEHTTQREDSGTWSRHHVSLQFCHARRGSALRFCVTMEGGSHLHALPRNKAVTGTSVQHALQVYCGADGMDPLPLPEFMPTLHALPQLYVFSCWCPGGQWGRAYPTLRHLAPCVCSVLPTV